MADEIATQVAAVDQSAATTSVSDGVQSGASTSTPASMPPASQESQYQSLRDAGKEYGYDLSSHSDDAAAFKFLVQKARQAEEAARYQPYGQKYLQHRELIEEALAKKQAEAAQKPKSWWNPPEYNQSWANQVTRNPQTGQLEGPPDVVHKVQAYQQYRQEFAEKLFSDPTAALRPLVEEIAQEQAKKLVSESLGGYQAQTFATSFTQENSGWIYAKDQAGNAAIDPTTGKPALSDLGKRFSHHVQTLMNAGITDERMQAQLAVSLTQADVARAQAGAPPQAAQANGQPALTGDPKKDFLNQSRNNGGNAIARANQGAAAAGSETVHGAVQNGRGRSLKEKLTEAVNGAGGIH